MALLNFLYPDLSLQMIDIYLPYSKIENISLSNLNILSQKYKSNYLIVINIKSNKVKNNFDIKYLFIFNKSNY